MQIKNPCVKANDQVYDFAPHSPKLWAEQTEMKLKCV